MCRARAAALDGHSCLDTDIGALLLHGFWQSDIARELGVTRQAIQKMLAA